MPGPRTIAAIVVVAVLAGVNVVAFVQMGVDKRRAERGASRLSERRLLAPIILGGLPGVLFGMKSFRHKTQKPSWQVKLVAHAAIFAGIAAGAWWLIGRIA